MSLSAINSAREKVRQYLDELTASGLICRDGQFFPSVHYPPITLYPPVTEESLFKGYTNPQDNLFVIYAHIPFCIMQCDFCHYPVKTRAGNEEKDRYLKMLEREFDLYLRRLGLGKVPARSILVGGGTPTLMTPAQLQRFLSFLTVRTDMSHCAQFSFDVEPSTLIDKDGPQRMKIMRDFGVDRLTIGVQSLDDNILKGMNRPHNAEGALKSIASAQKAGFKINIEFIFGYQGQTLEAWIKTVEQAVTLGVEEIQLYRLKIIPYGDHQAPITSKFAQGQEGFHSIEETMLMKEIAIRILNQNGYYENLSRVYTKDKNDYSRYANDQCCRLSDQIGIGLTAFSSLRDRFALNAQNFKEYYELIDEGKLPINRGLMRDRDAQLRWALILPLKNRNVFKEYFRKITGFSVDDVFRKKIDRLKEFDLLYEDDKKLELTAKGKFFADEVCQQFHLPDHMPFPETAYAQGPLNPYND